jgi:hypothetical protein
MNERAAAVFSCFFGSGRASCEGQGSLERKKRKHRIRERKGKRKRKKVEERSVIICWMTFADLIEAGK